MHRLLFVLAISGALMISAFTFESAVRAQTTLSEAHIQRIRQNCVTAQTALSQLHASDGVLRNLLGKLYENTSTKLMAPLNSRIALHRYGGLKLAATTLEYDRHFETFRTSYIDYERSMSRTLEINCIEKPVEFYTSVRSSREKRQKVHEDTENLIALLRAYKAEFEEFAKDFERGEQ